ncbi:hypothetical protein [Brevundimonas sp.]|uniref:hypothetical protein n=1 Tax=Brevundimonas sp. TaxID=1871086 RepID=UPI002D687DA1|nr:hypothetical protein [Brevundimonas sp.]HYC68414.1 hypothetical protein [Brevundimonas sp.]
MEFWVGVGLALAVSLMGRWVGLDRDRAFYPVILIVSASYYALFAAMAGATPVLGAETAMFAVFLIAGLVGFRSSLWVVVAGLLGHGLFDLGHELLVTNPGAPDWWRMFCLGYDVAAAACLAWLLTRPNASAARPAERHGQPVQDAEYYRLL